MGSKFILQQIPLGFGEIEVDRALHYFRIHTAILRKIRIGEEKKMGFLAASGAEIFQCCGQISGEIDGVAIAASQRSVIAVTENSFCTRVRAAADLAASSSRCSCK